MDPELPDLLSPPRVGPVMHGSMSPSANRKQETSQEPCVNAGLNTCQYYWRIYICGILEVSATAAVLRIWDRVILAAVDASTTSRIFEPHLPPPCRTARSLLRRQAKRSGLIWAGNTQGGSGLFTKRAWANPNKAHEGLAEPVREASWGCKRHSK